MSSNEPAELKRKLAALERQYSDRDAEATAWAEQATRSAARNATLERAIRAVCCALENLEHDGVRAASARTLRRVLTDGQEGRRKTACGDAAANSGHVVSVHDTAAYRATGDERGTT